MHTRYPSFCQAVAAKHREGASSQSLLQADCGVACNVHALLVSMHDDIPSLVYILHIECNLL